MQDFLTAAEAAKQLGYHLNHLYRLLADGTVKGEKWGGKVWMIHRKEIERIKSLRDENGRLSKGQI